MNVNFANYSGYRYIINATVAVDIISTSIRLGQCWLNGDRNWMYGFNFGYDSRLMATCTVDAGTNVSISQTVFSRQMVFNAEAVSNMRSFNFNWLAPVVQYGWRRSIASVLNCRNLNDCLMTAGLDNA